MAQYKLGRLPKKFDGRDFKFEDFHKEGSVHIPTIFGHGGTFKDWGMLGNDKYGDCVWAGAAHETMNYTNLAAGGVVGQEVVKFTDEGVLSDYGACTGFNPATGENDNGTEVRASYKYRQKTGIIDADGKRHKIGAYVSINPKNMQHLAEALWIFEGVGIGIEFPNTAMEQTNNSQPWEYETGAQIEGGHYINLIGKARPANQFTVITWGHRQIVSWRFLENYCEEAWAYITQEELNKRTQQNWGGFNWKALEEALTEPR